VASSVLRDPALQARREVFINDKGRRAQGGRKRLGWNDILWICVIFRCEHNGLLERGCQGNCRVRCGSPDVPKQPSGLKKNFRLPHDHQDQPAKTQAALFICGPIEIKGNWFPWTIANRPDG
jgi:hypothetical protein